MKLIALIAFLYLLTELLSRSTENNNANSDNDQPPSLIDFLSSIASLISPKETKPFQDSMEEEVIEVEAKVSAESGATKLFQDSMEEEVIEVEAKVSAESGATKPFQDSMEEEVIEVEAKVSAESGATKPFQDSMEEIEPPEDELDLEEQKIDSATISSVDIKEWTKRNQKKK